MDTKRTATIHRRGIVLRRAASLLLVAAIGVGLSCSVNPVTGKRQITLMSEEQEIQLGKEADPSIIAEYGLYEDAELAAVVDRIGQQMAKLSHRPNLEWHFRVLDSPVINAFALPGGYCYVTRGILAHMNNEAELAMVMGHEIGHVTARHGVEQQTRQTLYGAGLGLGSIFSKEVAALGGVLSQGLGILFMKYGRDDETQSDELGVEYAMKAGYDAEVGAKFFEVLDRQTKESGGSGLPTWLSTHPAPADRVVKTRALAAQRRADFPNGTRIAEAEFKSAVDGIVFGEDPRQGFFKGNTFMHPGLDFQLDLPAGWRTANTPSALLAQAPDKNAVMQMTLGKAEGDPQSHAQAVAQSANATIVQGRPETIGGKPAWIGVIRAPAENNATQDILAGYVQRPQGMLSILGQATSLAKYQEAFLQTIRSVKDLQDPEAKRMEPNRISLVTVKNTQTFAQAVQAAGASPATQGQVALVNNLQPESPLPAGFKLKVVKGNFQPAPRQAAASQ